MGAEFHFIYYEFQFEDFGKFFSHNKTYVLIDSLKILMWPILLNNTYFLKKRGTVNKCISELNTFSTFKIKVPFIFY